MLPELSVSTNPHPLQVLVPLGHPSLPPFQAGWGKGKVAQEARSCPLAEGEAAGADVHACEAKVPQWRGQG